MNILRMPYMDASLQEILKALHNDCVILSEHERGPPFRYLCKRTRIMFDTRRHVPGISHLLLPAQLSRLSRERE